MPETERRIYEVGGWGKRMGFGARPAVVVVDVNYDFIGDRPAPILESIEHWRYSCGDVGWRGVAAIAKLLAAARAKRVPIFYTTVERRADRLDYGRDRDKNFRTGEATSLTGGKGPEIPREIAPQPADIVISKKKASAFFGTPLASYLVDLNVDTLLVTGVSTSGCVRATVVDGNAYNFRVCVVEEGTFDRSSVAHKVNLFDMHMKYADVISVDETIGYLESLAATPAAHGA
ncbi:MAG TPA: isochorismatase family protein [Casimicrobiaceae bacterium]|nr:isochorismatase family protein [Casimicrobiaceae bacterium]